MLSNKIVKQEMASVLPVFSRSEAARPQSRRTHHRAPGRACSRSLQCSRDNVAEFVRSTSEVSGKEREGNGIEW